MELFLFKDVVLFLVNGKVYVVKPMESFPFFFTENWDAFLFWSGLYPQMNTFFKFLKSVVQ